MNKILSLLILSLAWVSCDDGRDAMAQQIITSRVQDRLNMYITIELNKCWQEMNVKASLAADSLIRVDPILVRLDSLQRPPKPVKPSIPVFERKKDSVQIAPLVIEPQEEPQQVVPN